MTKLSEMRKWAEKLSAWYQHAIAVLYERTIPTAEDLEDIFALFQSSAGTLVQDRG